MKKERTLCVALVGHIDHGKSSLLDALSELSTVEKEVGGITQSLRVREIISKNGRKITLLDTPGHKSFSEMRSRGVCAADIALLIVSAEDGTKEQTVEAYTTLKNNNIPCMVVLTKIDSTSAHIQKTKQELSIHGILIEGSGGTIPYVEVSAKEKKGLNDLLETMSLLADMREDNRDIKDGIVFDIFKDPKKGVSILIRLFDKSLTIGDVVLVGNTYTTVRLINSPDGTLLKKAEMGDVVVLYGFNNTPEIGKDIIITNKKEARKTIAGIAPLSISPTIDKKQEQSISYLIKSHTIGFIDAIKSICAEGGIPIVVCSQSGVGNVTENDARFAATTQSSILAFGVDIDKHAQQIVERGGVDIYTTDIIYNAFDYLKEKTNTKNREKKKVLGSAKIIRVFQTSKEGGIYGARIVGEGIFKVKGNISVVRSGSQIFFCSVETIEQKNTQQESVQGEKTEFACSLRCAETLMVGDTIQYLEEKMVS